MTRDMPKESKMYHKKAKADGFPAKMIRRPSTGLTDANKGYCRAMEFRINSKEWNTGESEVHKKPQQLTTSEKIELISQLCPLMDEWVYGFVEGKTTLVLDGVETGRYISYKTAQFTDYLAEQMDSALIPDTY